MKRLFAAAVMAAIVLMAAPAAAQQYPPTGEPPDGSVEIEVQAADVGGTGATAGTPAADATGTPAENDGSGTLPRTGDDSSIPLARIGLGLAALGGVATAVAAQRRRSVASAA